MLRSFIAASTAVLCVATASPAFAQSGAAATRARNCRPTSIPFRSRVCRISRARPRREGPAVYDELVGKDPAPTTGPRAVMLYSPKAVRPVDG